MFSGTFTTTNCCFCRRRLYSKVSSRNRSKDVLCTIIGWNMVSDKLREMCCTIIGWNMISGKFERKKRFSVKNASPTHKVLSSDCYFSQSGLKRYRFQKSLMLWWFARGRIYEGGEKILRVHKQSASFRVFSAKRRLILKKRRLILKHFPDGEIYEQRFLCKAKCISPKCILSCDLFFGPNCDWF